MISYPKLFHNLRQFGDPVNSRFGPIRERVGGQVRVVADELVKRRGINYKIGYLETLMLIAGVWDPMAMRLVAPNAQHDLFTPQMAYGPRMLFTDHEHVRLVRDDDTEDTVMTLDWDRIWGSPRIDQPARVIETLRRDPDCRQAVIFIGRPGEACSSDLPCTLTYQVLLREGILHAVVSMRSWDIVKGLAYDLMMFGGLLQALAYALDVDYGTVTVTAGSMHLYESDIDREPVECRDRWGLDLDRGTGGRRDWVSISAWAGAQAMAAPWQSTGGVPDGVILDKWDPQEEVNVARPY